MNKYCPFAKYDLTGTCIKPLSLKDLLILCKIENASEIMDIKLSYGEIQGSERLKNAIASLYDKQKSENITVTHGAIGANQLLYNALIDTKSEVIPILPIYQQHYSIPKSLGATIKPVFLSEENNWKLNINELEKNITARTKVICLNNPNNPTGAIMSDKTLYDIVELAEKYDIWILADEVYRGLNYNENRYSTSVSDIYEKGISVGSMSKTYSLPGLRVGWICANEGLINEVNKHREYNTISVSILDDYFATIALENKEVIEQRNYKIMQEGLNTLIEWLQEEIYVKTNIPQGGTTALIRYKKDISSKILCRGLYEKTGVLLLPGEVLDMEGTVRIGFCTDKEVLKTGLKEFSKILREM